jgi:Flp pilus assembly protein TadB
MVQQEEEKKLNALAESANSVKSAGDRLTRAIQEGRRLLREKLKNYALVCCLFVFLFVVLGGGLRLNPGGAFLGAATGTPLIICGFSRLCGRAHKQAGQSNDAPT